MNVPWAKEVAKAPSVAAKSKRASRGPIVVMLLGAVLIVGHNFVQDYAQALVSPDGLYIPDARHVVPLGTPAGPYTHTFRIYNARPHSVTVEAQADCGCTGLSWTRTVLPPMGWQYLRVSFSNTKLSSSFSSNIAVEFGEEKRTVLLISISRKHYE